MLLLLFAAELLVTTVTGGSLLHGLGTGTANTAEAVIAGLLLRSVGVDRSLQSGLDIRPIITHHFPVDDYEQGFEIMQTLDGRPAAHFGLRAGDLIVEARELYDSAWTLSLLRGVLSALVMLGIAPFLTDERIAAVMCALAASPVPAGPDTLLPPRAPRGRRPSGDAEGGSAALTQGEAGNRGSGVPVPCLRVTNAVSGCLSLIVMM